MQISDKYAENVGKRAVFAGKRRTFVHLAQKRGLKKNYFWLRTGGVASRLLLSEYDIIRAEKDLLNIKKHKPA